MFFYTHKHTRICFFFIFFFPHYNRSYNRYSEYRILYIDEKFSNIIGKHTSLKVEEKFKILSI